MPEHTPSVEARWLSENYGRLDDYRGEDLRDRWIAVVGEEVVDSDDDPAVLVERVGGQWPRGAALFARVLGDRLG